MKFIKFIVLIIIITIPLLLQSAGEKIAVISPSISTTNLANQIMMKGMFVRSNYRQCDAILVVVRSALYYPLFQSYNSVKELENAANMQLNISGHYFHVYFFGINDDLSVFQIAHEYSEAE